MNCLLLLLALAADNHPPAPLVHEQTITVSAETLAGLPRVKVEAKEHDNPAATYEGVALGAILERAGLPRGEKLRGKALRAILVITAADNYQVIFTLADTILRSPIARSSSPIRKTGSRCLRRKAPSASSRRPRSGLRDGFGT